MSSRLVVGFTTLEGPAGDRCHEVVLGPKHVEVLAGHSNPDVVLTLDWDVAVSIAKGEESAQRAFLAGTMTLSGDAAALLGYQDALNAVTDKMSQLRQNTEYA